MLTSRIRPPTMAVKNQPQSKRKVKYKNSHNVWKKSYFKKSLCGWAEWTAHQLFAKTLKMLNTTTRKAADHLALKPTATMTQAARPMMETKTRMKFHSPWRMKPRKRKIKRTRPVRRKLEQSVSYQVPGKGKAYYYFLRSFSVRVGRPAKTDLRVIIESLNTMKRPPMTLRLRRKKFRSKIRP